MPTLFFSPHMTSVDNEAKRASGHADVPLSERGRQEAQELGQHYATKTLDAVFCSDLQRAVVTSQIALRAAPQLRSIRELVAHMIAVRARCFYYLFQEDKATLTDLVTWDQGDVPERSTLELLGGLDLTWQVLQGSLARWRSPDLEDMLRVERGGIVSTYTRQWVIWHMLEHDLHHAIEHEIFVTTQQGDTDAIWGMVCPCRSARCPLPCS